MCLTVKDRYVSLSVSAKHEPVAAGLCHVNVGVFTSLRRNATRSFSSDL